MIKQTKTPPSPLVSAPFEAKNTVLDEIADGFYECDLNGKLVSVNLALCRILGYPDPDHLLAEARLQSIDTEARQKIARAFQHVRESGEPIAALQIAIAGNNGEPRYLEASVALRRGAHQKPLGFHGIVRDVTERAHAESSLNQRFSQLALLQQVDVELNQTLALDSVLAVALNAALLLSNAEAGFVGLIEHERIRLARAVGGFPEPWMSLDTGIIARVIRQQHAERVLDVSLDPDYYADIPTTRAEIAVPLAAHGKVVGVLNLETARPDRFTEEVFEFTQFLSARAASAVENARLYETVQAQLVETRSLYQQVSDLEQLKTHMIRVAAHDLRGPLSIIGSYVELIEEDLKPYYGELDGMYVNSIRQAVIRMTQMTSDILSLERLQEHRDVTLVRVQLGNLLEHTVEEYREVSQQHQQALNVRTEPLSVHGVSTELHEAIANLIGNAIKYTPDGGKIEARLQRDGDWALLEVEDTGYGIPDDQQDELFQPFRRIKTRETFAIEGTGLGLYLVKKIADRHNGSVCFRSQHGKGSTFGFRLPLAKLGSEPQSDG